MGVLIFTVPLELHNVFDLPSWPDGRYFQRLPLGLSHYDRSYPTGQGCNVGVTLITLYISSNYTLEKLGKLSLGGCIDTVAHYDPEFSQNFLPGPWRYLKSNKGSWWYFSPWVSLWSLTLCLIVIKISTYSSCTVYIPVYIPKYTQGSL